MQVLKDNGDDARKIGIMVASHNEDTVRFAIENMKSIGISPEDKVICFGQLLGMCDYITFPLGKLWNIESNMGWDNGSLWSSPRQCNCIGTSERFTSLNGPVRVSDCQLNLEQA